MSWLAPNMVPCAHPCRSCMPTLARRPLCRGELEASKRTQQPQAQSRRFAAAQTRCSATEAATASTEGPATDAQPAAEAAASSKSVKRRGAFEIQWQEKTLPNSRVQITVTVPAAACKKTFNATLQSFRKTTKLAGFRDHAKIPDSALYSQIEGGRTSVKQGAVESLLNTALPQALKKYKGIAMNETLNIENPIDELAAAFDVDKDFTFVVSVDLAPEVKWKQSYSDIEVEVEAAGNEASDREHVENMLSKLQQDHSSQRIVQGRGLQRGDIAICDFDAIFVETGEAIPGARQAHMRLNTNTSDKAYIPGLAAGMEGMVVGDRREVAVTFPDTWVPESLAGLDAKCDVTVNELFEFELVEILRDWGADVRAQLTDEFMRKQVPTCSGVEDVREQLFEATQQETALSTQNRVVEALGKAVAEIVDTDVPEFLVRSMGEQMYQTHLLNLQQEGKISKEMVEQLANEQLMKNYIEQRREELEGRVRASVGFDNIYIHEHLQTTKEELEAEMASAVAEFKRVGQDYDEGKLREQAFETLKGNKTLEFLNQTCNIKVNAKP